MVDIRHRDEPPNYGSDGLMIPPHSMEAEQAVLGGLLHDHRAWDRIYDVVSEKDFYTAAHRTIWRTIEQLIDRNKPVDAITVLDQSDEDTRPIVAGLLSGVPSAVHVRRYAEIVREKSVLRQLITVGAEISQEALAFGADANEALEKAEARVLSVTDKGARSEDREPVPIYRAVADAVDWLEADRTDVGIPTGLSAIDAMLPGRGLQPAQLIVVAGRPSMGKSSLTYQIAEATAHAGRTVLYCSLESSRREIGTRTLRWHESMLTRSEALSYFANLPLIIDDTPAIGLSHLRVVARRTRRQRGLALIVVDYLQLMKARAQNRLEEVSEISRGLKAVAKELDVPVMVVSQLSRSVEQRPDKRPILSDLRESGQIEQDADVVLMCYRDEYYHADSPEKGYGDIFLRKNRDGPTGGAFVRWDGPRTRWIDFQGPRPTHGEPQVALAGDSKKAPAFRPKDTDQ